ncbi:MAG: hypothetical protein WA020_10720 [Candidatus Acidiferrales bacterium]
MAKIGLVEQAIEGWCFWVFSTRGNSFLQKMRRKWGFSVHDPTTDGVAAQNSEQANFEKTRQNQVIEPGHSLCTSTGRKKRPADEAPPCYPATPAID